MRAPKATMLARRRCGCSSHRPLAPVPLFLQSQPHSTALPSAKRYDNRYGAKWKSNFRECPIGEVRRIPILGTGVKIALAAAHFHGIGVARQGPWVTWVNSPQRTPRSGGFSHHPAVFSDLQFSVKAILSRAYNTQAGYGY